MTESELAYRWAMLITDREITRKSTTAYERAKNQYEIEFMLDHVVESEWAFKWARDIGDKASMRTRITDAAWKRKWNKEFKETI